MSLNNSEQEELAGQLRCPSGERGIAIAQNMDFTNANIIEHTIDSIEVADNDHVLEIGPGNGSHVWKVLEKAANVHYQGVDISETMVDEAEKLNAGVANVFFRLSDGTSLPFEGERFDKIFTTNTIYFWEEPTQYAAELFRAVKQGGLLSIGYIPKRIMEHIPFTRHGFTLYDEEAVRYIMVNAGFEIVNELTGKEIIKGPHGEDIEREFVITVARKA